MHIIYVNSICRFGTKKRSDGNIIFYLTYKFLYILIMPLISKQYMILSEFKFIYSTYAIITFIGVLFFCITRLVMVTK